MEEKKDTEKAPKTEKSMIVTMKNMPEFRDKDSILDDINKRLSQNGIRKRFFNAKLSDFKDLPQNLIAGENGFFITGPRGVGKTHLLSAIARETVMQLPLTAVVNHGEIMRCSPPMPVFYPLLINVPRLLLRLRGAFGNDDVPGENEIIAKVCSASVLLLDDIGVEKASDWVMQTLYLIIDQRYNDMRKTYISSNLTLKQLSLYCDDRIASRIAGMTNTLRMQGKDRRFKS